MPPPAVFTCGHVWPFFRISNELWCSFGPSTRRLVRGERFFHPLPLQLPPGFQLWTSQSDGSLPPTSCFLHPACLIISAGCMFTLRAVRSPKAMKRCGEIKKYLKKAQREESIKADFSLLWVSEAVHFLALRLFIAHVNITDFYFPPLYFLLQSCLYLTSLIRSMKQSEFVHFCK